MIDVQDDTRSQEPTGSRQAHRAPRGRLKKSGLPRALRNHLGARGTLYRRTCEALAARLGLDVERAAWDVLQALRDAGRARLDLEAAEDDVEALLARGRRREARAASRVTATLRAELRLAEAHLAELCAPRAAQREPSEAERFAAMHAERE